MTKSTKHQKFNIKRGVFKFNHKLPKEKDIVDRAVLRVSTPRQRLQRMFFRSEGNAVVSQKELEEFINREIAIAKEEGKIEVLLKYKKVFEESK